MYSYLSDLNRYETLDALVNGSLNAGELMKQDAPILGWNAMDVTYKILLDKDPYHISHM